MPAGSQRGVSCSRRGDFRRAPPLRTLKFPYLQARALQTPSSSPTVLSRMHKVPIQKLMTMVCCLATSSERQDQALKAMKPTDHGLKSLEQQAEIHHSDPGLFTSVTLLPPQKVTQED